MSKSSSQIRIEHPLDVFSRRALIGASATVAIGLAAKAHEIDTHNSPSFSFVHITDIHIQPERDAVVGVQKAIDLINSLPEKPAFALVGGDLVMNAAKADLDRATKMYDLWDSVSAELKIPLHYSIGNHDLFDLNSTGKPGEKNPDYGKGLWKRRLKLENAYTSFDHMGWRFIILDTVGITPSGRDQGFIDKDQLTWIDNLLRKTPQTMPIVFLSHFPIFTIFAQYVLGTTSAATPGLIVKNGRDFFKLIQKYNVKAVFQGHTHVLEECSYLGTKYITGGSICGEWWRGKRLGVHPEGFILARCQANEINWQYMTYGGAR